MFVPSKKMLEIIISNNNVISRKMKKILMLMLCMSVHSILFAQSGEKKKSVFQFSFIPPLSTNGVYSSQYTNVSSLNLLVGISNNEEAFTLGGVSNITLDNAKGVQIAGLSNYIGNEGQGFQLAGITNINKNQFSGFQLAGLLNTASAMKGLQLSGVTNIAQEVNGLQFAGLVNIAKDVRGVQFAGLINIADNSDCPIGLINLIKNGEKSIAVTYDILGSTVASFRSGGKYTYGILGVGFNHLTKGNSLVTEGGLGAHIPIVSWFRVNNELKFTSIGCNSSDPVFNTGYSLIPAFRIGKHFELFAGASINYMETKDTSNDKIFPNRSLWKKHSSTRLQQLYFGYQCGIQYIF